MKSVLNHIALLVPNAVKSAEYLRQFDFKISPTEKWDSGGTLEIYVGDLNSEIGNLPPRPMSARGPPVSDQSDIFAQQFFEE